VLGGGLRGVLGALFPYAEDLVDAVGAEAVPVGGRGGDDQFTAELDLGEGHVVMDRRTACRSHAHHLFSAVTDFLG
jgi:hypothetical protein